MQSILGALLAAGYASAASAAIAASSQASTVSQSVQAQLTKSFDGAIAIAKEPQFAQYSAQIVAGAKQSFLQGDQWAYTAGIIAVLLGAALVFFMFPRKDEEVAMLARYHAEDTRVATSTVTS